MDAIEEIRAVVKGDCYISGMSAVVTDTKNLSNQETPVYVLIAVILAVIDDGFGDCASFLFIKHRHGNYL